MTLSVVGFTEYGGGQNETDIDLCRVDSKLERTMCAALDINSIRTIERCAACVVAVLSPTNRPKIGLLRIPPVCVVFVDSPLQDI